MGEFGWQYINANTLISASGPTGSISFRVEDVGGKVLLVDQIAWCIIRQPILTIRLAH